MNPSCFDPQSQIFPQYTAANHLQHPPFFFASRSVPPRIYVLFCKTLRLPGFEVLGCDFGGTEFEDLWTLDPSCNPRNRDESDEDYWAARNY